MGSLTTDEKRTPDEATELKGESKPKLTPWKAYLLLWSPSYVPLLFTFGRLLAVVAALGAGATLPMMAVIFGDFVNDFNGWALGRIDPGEFKDAVAKNAVYLVYLFIGKFLCDYFSVLVFHISASQTCRGLRMKYMDTVIHQPMEYFDENSTASVSSRLGGDVNFIEIGMGEKVSTFFQGLSMMVSSFIVGFAKQWKLTFVSISVIPWTIAVVGALSSVETKLETKIRAQYSEATAVADEALSSPQNIAALGATEKIVRKYKGYIDRAMVHLKWMGPLISSIYGNMFFSMHCCYALALYMGVKLVNNGEIKDGGTVLTVMFCAILASGAMGLIAPIIPEAIKAAAAAQSVVSLLHQNGQNIGESDKSNSSFDTVGEGHVSLSNISFAYPARASMPVLSELNLEAPAHQITAIVGPSGSGKSTIIALLQRWYNPLEGDIFLDGKNMRDYSPAAWRSNIGLVQQDPMLFNDTIFQNVLNGFHGGNVTGLSHQDQERLVTEACIKSNAHEFITQLPQGYQTKVGERATFLSGGQKQRIAIARAIISNPKILLLDEATSALDAESTEAVEDALDNASQGRTTITIVHNLASVRRAAKIVIMNKGRVAEEGTHESLTTLGGMYCQLLQAQTPASPGDLPNEGKKGCEILARIPTTHDEETGMASRIIPLDSPEISRRHGIPWGVFHLMKRFPAMVPPFVLANAIGLVASASFPVTAYLFSKLVTVFQLQFSSNFVSRGNFWALMFFFLALSEILSYGLSFYFLGVSTIKSSQRYRPTYLRSMLEQDTAFFQTDGHSSGSLTTLLSTDPEELEMLTSTNLGLIWIYIWDIIACSVLSLAVYWKLGLVATFGCLPIILIAGTVRLKMDVRAYDRCERNFLESARFGSEVIGGIRTVSSLMLEQAVIERYGRKLDAAINRSSRQSMWYYVIYAFSDSVDLLVMALIFWYGGTLLADGEMSVEDYFIIYSATLFGGQAAGFALGFTTSLSKSQAAANRILHLLSTKPLINSTTGIDPSSLPSGPPAVEFHHVNFRYPNRPETAVLQDVSFSVSLGDSVCLVGRSGCGKSTILSLVERFFDCSSGSLLISGTSISKIDIKSYRASCAFVGQETTLYQGTIRENLLLGVAEDSSVSEDEIVTACRDANIHEFITSLPEGYETHIGPRGTALSGGQRQRLAIARALLRKPRILLLDEATSALDAENERLVGEAVAQAAKGKTVLSATHHGDAIRRADRVIVMDCGRVVEEGTYDELVRRKGGWLWRLKGEGEMS